MTIQSVSASQGERDAAQCSHVAAAPEELVLFVHGTFAYDESDEATDADQLRWWQRGSKFSVALGNKLKGYRIVPPGSRISEASPPWWWFGKTSSNKVRPPYEAVFHWSGENLESARRAGGRRLLDHIDRLLTSSPPDQNYHLVAHSHGGGVVWEALCLAYERDRKGQDRTGAVERLRSWITVATPFMHYRADWSRLPWLFLWLMSFVALWLYEYRWWFEFWNQQSSAYRFLGTTYVAFATIHVVAVLLVLFPVYSLWSLFRWLDSGAGQSQEKEQTFYDFCSSLVATGFIILLVAVVAAIVWKRGDSLWQLVRSKEPWNASILEASIWTLAAFLGVLVSCFGIGLIVRAHFREKSRERLARDAWAKFQDRHRALPEGYEAFDEAVIGLRSIVEIPEDRILPRIPAPGSHRFTSRGFIRQPEYERERAEPFLWGVNFLLLPYSITRDWIVRPFYNDVFAPLVDRFVITRLWKSAHGTDITGARIAAVTTTPVPSPVQSFVEAWRPNSPSASLKQTRQRVEQAITRYVDGLRRRLGLNPTAAIEILDLLKKAMGSQSEQTGLLFHTDYFTQPSTGTSLADELAAPMKSAPAPYAPPTAPPPPARQPRDPCYSVQYQFFATVGRILVVLLLVLAPAVVLAGLGRYVLYPLSLDRAVDGAEQDAGMLLAIRFDTAEPSGADGRSVWIEYLTALPISIAEQKLAQASQVVMRDTVLYWKIEYATRLAARGNPKVALEVITEVADDICKQPPRNDQLVPYAGAAIEYVMKRHGGPDSPRLTHAANCLLASNAMNAEAEYKKKFEIRNSPAVANGTYFSSASVEKWLSEYSPSLYEPRSLRSALSEASDDVAVEDIGRVAFALGMYEVCLECLPLIRSPEGRATLEIYILHHARAKVRAT